MTPENLLAWAGTMALVSITPGAGTIASMSSGAIHGFPKGCWTSVGQQLALALQWTIAVLGLASLLHSLPAAFLVLQTVGVAYLAVLGLRLIILSFREDKSSAPRQPVIPESQAGQLLHGFLVNATNPKAYLALFAIAPRFLHQEQPLAFQATAMGIAMVAIDLAVMMGYTMAGARLLSSIRDPAWRRGSDRIFGALFVLAAIFVARV